MNANIGHGWLNPAASGTFVPSARQPRMHKEQVVQTGLSWPPALRSNSAPTGEGAADAVGADSLLGRPRRYQGRSMAVCSGSLKGVKGLKG